jgi:hypothetical protein
VQALQPVDTDEDTYGDAHPGELNEQSDLEAGLCTLWDMTVDEHVCAYLCTRVPNFVAITAQLLDTTDSRRVTVRARTCRVHSGLVNRK